MLKPLLIGFMYTLVFQARRRVKRFDEDIFDDAETEDVVTTGCPAGSISNSDDTCTECTAGTYSNTDTDPEVCSSCALDSYSGEKATECTSCGAGLGTLEVGSDDSSDCIGVFRVHRSHTHRTYCISINHLTDHFDI